MQIFIVAAGIEPELVLHVREEASNAHRVLLDDKGGTWAAAIDNEAL